MKILVPISKVPDTTSKIAFSDNNSKFNTDNVQFIINPTDEWYALTKALELKEAGKATEVVVINVGLAENEQIIRKALAIGADSAIRVDLDPTDAFQVAAEIAANAIGFDLVITGKETIDYNSFEVGGMIAEFMGCNAVALVSKLDVDGNKATATRDIEGGTETVEIGLPAVVCATKDLAAARIPNMKGIMGARSKPLSVVAASTTEQVTKITSYILPDKAKECKYVSADNVEELVRLLHEEAKVI